MKILLCLVVLITVFTPIYADTEYPVSALYRQGAPINFSGDYISPNNDNCYWIVKGIEPGDYSLQLEMQSSSDNLLKSLYWDMLYLNDKIVHFDSAGPDVLRDGGFYATAQTPLLKLKDGDVIRLAQRNVKVGKLVLARQRLAFAPQLMGEDLADWAQNDKNWTFNDSTFGDKLHLAVKNNTGRERKIKLSVRIVDFFQNLLKEENLEVTIGPQWQRDFEYPRGGADQYRAYVKLTDDFGNKNETVFSTKADCAMKFRKKLWLNDNWQFAEVRDDRTLKTRILQSEAPADAQWRQISLPHLYKNHLAWYKKDFIIPPEFRGKRYILHFYRISMCSEITVNGHNLGRFGMEPYPRALPFDLDITDYVREDGANQIFLAACGTTMAYSEEALRLGEKLPSVSLANDDKMCWELNKQGIGDIYLAALPEVYLGDIKVLTSFREKTIKVSVAPLPTGYRAEHRILYQDREVVPPFIGQAHWDQPILWGPAEFPLLQLETSLYAPDGKLVDIKNTRFGFREIWTDKMNVMWNGKLFRGITRYIGIPSWNNYEKGDIAVTDQYAFVNMYKAKQDGNRLLTEVMGCETFYDLADEVGFLSSYNSPVLPSAQMTLKLSRNETFWRAKALTDVAMVDKFYNHPSIFIWYLSNELWAGRGSDDRAYQLLAPIAQKVEDADPSRFVECGSDLDLRGLTKIVSTHYPATNYMREPFAFPPDMFYWRKLNQSFFPGEMVPAGQVKTVGSLHGESLIEWGVKPIKANETGWESDYDFPYGSTRFFGDASYSSYSYLLYMHRILVKHEIQAQRDAALFAITPWRYFQQDDNAWLAPELDVVVIQKYHAFYSGTDVSYDVNIFHDRLQREELQFGWQLTDASGKICENGEKTLTADFCESFREKIRFTAGAPGDYKLSVSINGEEKQVLPIQVYAKEPPVSGPNLIGAETDLQTKKDELLQKVEKGETVIIMPRDNYPAWLPAALTKTRVPGSKNFSFRPEHPVLAGLSEDDISYWYPDHLTGTEYFDKPFGGNVKTIIEAGGPNGLCYSGLIEVPYGKGCFLISRLTLDQEKNPIARKLLVNMLKYRAPELGTLGVMVTGNSPFMPYLKKYGVKMEDAKFGAIDRYQALLVDGSIQMTQEQMAQLKAFKGSVIVRNPGPQYGITTQKVAPKWNGRCLRAGYRPEMAGLNNHDFFYLKMDPDKSWYCLTNPDLVIAQTGPGNEFTEVIPLMYPVYIGKQGNLIFDNFNWTTDEPAIASKAENVITSLLTNLGIQIDNTRRKLEIPDGLVFTPVDLTQYLDREFADDVDDDGKGGWSDQGPECDMRNVTLPAGIHKLGKAEYKIERPKSCLALSSIYRKNGYTELTLPINRKFNWLFLLHSSAWTGMPVQYTMTVKYSDGTAYEIAMSGRNNMHDWSSDPKIPFAQETDTITQCVYTVPQKLFKQGSFFSTAWSNPVPEKEVDSISFKSMKRGIPIIIALSTARAGNIRDDVSPDNAALAAKLTTEGEAFEKAGKFQEAVACYEQALKLNPGQLHLYMAIGSCHEALKDYRSAYNAYERSCKAEPNQPAVWELMNNLKEKLKE